MSTLFYLFSFGKCSYHFCLSGFVSDKFKNIILSALPSCIALAKKR